MLQLLGLRSGRLSCDGSSLCNVVRRASSGRYQLHEAARGGDIECLAELARTSSHQVDTYDDEGQTALHLAADSGSAEAVQLLSHVGADVNVPREEDNRTPLHIAVNEGHIEVVGALLDAGAAVDSVDCDGWHPLHVGAYYGQPQIADLLLRHKAQVMARTSKGQTPLHIAVEMAESKWLHRTFDYLLLVKLLLGAGADVNAQDGYGQAPIHVAAKNLDVPTLELLMEHGADVAAKAGNGGRTALHIAASRSSPEVAGLLLAKGADIDAVDEAGVSPLMAAVEAHAASMVKWLLDHGASTQQMTEGGWAALHYAVRLQHPSCLLVLLQQEGCDIELEDATGLTPLMTAAEVDDEEVAGLLLDKGAAINHAGAERRITALHVATYHGSESCARLLVDKGVNVNAQDANGHSALHIASLLNRGHFIPLLLHAGADTGLRDKTGKTAAQLAMDKGSDEVMRLLDVLKL